MAGRPKKDTVDYFPHYAEGGKTIYILETRYGNNGYAFWFKLLQRLCRTPGHISDARNSEEWEFLTAKALVSNETAIEILDLLAKLDAIDRELWEDHRLIWSQNLVDNLKDVYRKRGVPLPQKPIIVDGYITYTPISDADNETTCVISAVENTQSKVKKRKVKKSKEEESRSNSNAGNSDTPDWLLLLTQHFNNFNPDKKWISMIERAWTDINLESTAQEFISYWKKKPPDSIEARFVESCDHASRKGKFKNKNPARDYTKGKYGHVVRQ